MSIIHLSDLHVGAGDNLKLTKRLVAHIVETHDPAVSAVAITGDLVETPHARLFGQLTKALEPLRDAGFTAFIVPGNHDLFPRGLDLGRLTSASILWRSLVRRFCPPSEQQGMMVWRWHGVQIIGLDTMAGSGDDWEVDLAQGCVGAHQLAQLTAIMEVGAVVLGHHRVWWDDMAHRLEDADKLHAVLDPRASMYLCGHQHEAHTTKRGDVVYIAAPRSTELRSRQLRYQLIAMDGAASWCYA